MTSELVRSDASDLMAGTFTQRECALVELLALATRERAQAQASLEANRAADLDEAERAYRHERSLAQEAHDTADTELTSKRERSLARIEEKFEAAFREAERVYQTQRVDLLEAINHDSRAADETMKESLWLAETVFDAAHAKPKQAFERIKRAADAARKQATEIETHAAHLAQGQFKLVTDVGADATSQPNAQDPQDAFTQVEEHLQAAQQGLVSLQRARILKTFHGMLFLLPLVLIGGGVLGAWGHSMVSLGLAPSAAIGAVAFGLVFVVLILPLRVMGLGQLRAAADPIARHTSKARRLADAILDIAESQCGAELQHLAATKKRDTESAQLVHRRAVREIEKRRETDVQALDKGYLAQSEQQRLKREEDIGRIEREADERLAQIRQTLADVAERTEAIRASRLAEIEQEAANQREQLTRIWHERMTRINDAAIDMQDRAEMLFPAWQSSMWQAYHPPAAAAPAIQFGSMLVNMADFEGALPDDPSLTHEVPARMSLPAMLDFPGRCSLLIECGPEHRPAAIATLQNVMLRLLTSIPPGKVRFTIMDPVGLGQSFAGFMHLADFDEALVANRIWTDPKHIEKRLTDLTEHMEKVIQKYLRNEFESIESYNESAGEIAEPYRFLVIADYPASITEASAQRLKSILESGARCGVYTLILTDPAAKLPAGLTLEDLERHALTVVETDAGLRMAVEPLNQLPLALDAPPDDEFLSRLVRRVGELSKDAGRVEVPFQKITPAPEAMWQESCAKELRVPLGRAGATKLQYLTLGRGTSQHVLIAGKTGSGKSTMLHVLVASLAMWYSPHEVEFYLVDFKKGVEFKTYATHRLAHARAVAVESDREFGLSVLHKLDTELKRRGDLYREVGAQDIAGFRERQPDVHMPRTLLIIDEFQEFFVEDDKIAQEAALLLDRLVRQGRAFGMHVLLGSQTLSGAYSLARSTVGQMAVRIALQCSETDSYLILSEDNAAARLLARPGEAIYNDANGMIEGNSPFQIAWLPDSVRDHALDLVRKRVEYDAYQPPEPQIVFEGNVPSRIEDNHELARAIKSPTREMPTVARAWFGEPVAIKEPTAASFRRHTGSNCLIVGQQDDEALALNCAALVSLAAQFPRKGARFFILDGTPADDPRHGVLASLAQALPHHSRIGTWRDADTMIDEIASELTTRETQNQTDEDTIVLILHGLHRFRGLRRKEENFSFSADPDEKPSADKQLASIVREGPGLGIHTILWADTIGNLERAFDRQTIGEFDARVLFQMNANDSTALIDSPAAGRLGQARALLYSEESGTFEKFRPYAQPSAAWVRELAEALKR
ncbi:MAG: hypothetical protein KF757_05165 [Phycisphaeraceae bacterium]|nr:hypothetical protein [Phycisphaeraceae bacterium]MCW5763842.1 hypothetical protein [Phycisphaeraceae bacterium]